MQTFILSVAGSQCARRDRFVSCRNVLYRVTCLTSYELGSDLSTNLHYGTECVWKSNEKQCEAKSSIAVDNEISNFDEEGVEDCLINSRKSNVNLYVCCLHL